MKRSIRDCPRCQGTGISSTGPADANCGDCKGRGYLLADVDDDEVEEPESGRGDTE